MLVNVRRSVVVLIVGVVAVVGSSSLAGAKEPFRGAPSPDLRLGFVLFGEHDGRFLAVALCNGDTFERGRSQSFRGHTVTVATDAGTTITARVGRKRVTGAVELTDGRRERFEARPGWYAAQLQERCGASLAAAAAAG